MGTNGRPTPEGMLTATVCVPQHVVFRAFPAETVVLNLDTGTYHSVNPVGGRFLEVLEQVGSVREALARLGATFPQQDAATIEQDLCEFLADLSERGLIEVKAV